MVSKLNIKYSLIGLLLLLSFGVRGQYDSVSLVATYSTSSSSYFYALALVETNGFGDEIINGKNYVYIGGGVGVTTTGTTGTITDNNLINYNEPSVTSPDYANATRAYIVVAGIGSSTEYMDTIIVPYFSKETITKYYTTTVNQPQNIDVILEIFPQDNGEMADNKLYYCEGENIIYIPPNNRIKINETTDLEHEFFIEVSYSNDLINWYNSTYYKYYSLQGLDSIQGGGGSNTTLPSGYHSPGDTTSNGYIIIKQMDSIKLDVNTLNPAININNAIYCKMYHHYYNRFGGVNVYTYIFPQINIIPPTPTLSYTTTSPPCFGGTNSILTIDSVKYGDTYTQNGDSLRFTFSDSAQIAVRNDTITNLPLTIDSLYLNGTLPPGKYNLIVEKIGGCIGDPIEIIIPETPKFLVAVDSVNHNKCFNETNGKIHLSFQNGQPPYTLKLFDNNTNTLMGNYNVTTSTYIISNLQANNYRLEVIDMNECNSFPQNTFININQPNPLSFNAITQNPKCFGDNNGSITIHNVSGGTSPYLYSFDYGITYNTDTSLLNIPAGTYNFELKDLNNCTASQSFALSQPNQLTLQVDSFHNPICNQLNSGNIFGDISVSSSGGTLDYIYYNSITSNRDTTSSLIHIFTNLLANNYTLYVEDNYGCKDSINQIITEPSAITYSFTDTLIPSCTNTNDGKIGITISGGTPNYIINSQTITSIFTDSLLYGDSTYQYTISDTKGCSQLASVLLPNPPVIIANFSINNVSCFGDSNGNIIASISGGTGDTNNYQFNWQDSANNTISTIKNLNSAKAGNYSLTVTDENGCTKTFNVTITQPQPLKLHAFSSVKPTCKNRFDGAIQIDSVFGGSAPYQYNLNGNTQFNSLFSNIKDTTYNIIISDLNNCTVDSVITLQATMVSFTNTPQHVNCYGDSTATITVNPISGASPFQYNIQKENIWSSTNVNTHYSLWADTFLISIKDNNNCPSDTQQIIINQNTKIIPQLTVVNQPFCELPNATVNYSATGGLGALTQNWLDTNLNPVNPNSLGEGIFYFQVSDSLNCKVTDTVQLINNPSPSFHLQLIDSAYCNKPLAKANIVIDSNTSLPYSVQWNDANNQTTDTAINLLQGSYMATLTDNRGCSVTENIIITDGAPLVVSTLSTINSNCGQADGSAKINLSGGVSPYQINWNDSLNQATDSAIYLKANTYNVLITDSVGCINTHLVSINDNSAPQIDSLIVNEQSFCRLNNGILIGYVSNGLPPYTYSWKNNSNLVIGSSDTLTNIKNGNYTFEVQDSAGCKIAQTVQLLDDSTKQPIYQVLMDSAACGNPTGKIILTPSNGLAPYNYTWQHNTDTTNYTDSLLAGTYTTFLADSKGCLDTISITVIDKKKPQIVFVSKTNADCNLPTGSATIAVTNGKAPYKFVWNTPSNQDSTTAINLTNGTYQVYMIDSDSCTSNTLTISIVDNPSMAVSLASLTPTTCSYSKDGKAQVNVTGLHSPYTYQWSNGQDTNYIDTLLAGQTKVYITDTMGCRDSINLTVPSPSPISLFNIQKTQPTCFGGCDGAIQVFAQGGTSPYSFIWNNTVNNQMLSNVCSDTHTLQIKDANNCILDTNIILPNPPKVTSIGVPDTVIICTGQDYVIDISNNFFNSNWSRSTDSWTYLGDSLSINETGIYYVNTFTNNGCFVLDTFFLETRSDILQANFISPTQTVIGDTVVCIDVTWPPAQGNSWVYPADTIATLIDSTYDRITLVFNKSGVYSIYMHSYLSDCKDSLTKEIEVFATRDSIDQGIRPLENINHILEVIVYPNPNNGNFTINVTLDAISDATIQIYDLINYLQYHQEIQTGNTNYTYQVNLPSLQQGVYVLRLTALNEVKLFKFVIN